MLPPQTPPPVGMGTFHTPSHTPRRLRRLALACMRDTASNRDPACNRDPASISTSYFNPRPYISRTRLLLEHVNIVNFLLIFIVTCPLC